jgi:hypothetical protein
MIARLYLENNETLAFGIYVAYLLKIRTPAGGQFGWGGTLLKGYQQGSKVGSTGSEIRWRVQRQKPA